MPTFIERKIHNTKVRIRRLPVIGSWYKGYIAWIKDYAWKRHCKKTNRSPLTGIPRANKLSDVARLCPIEDDELIKSIVESYSFHGFRLLKKLNKMQKGRSKPWFVAREKLIKELISIRMMHYMNMSYPREFRLEDHIPKP